MITGLDLLFLEVNSLEESLAFYEGVLGMEIESVNYDSEPPMAKLVGGDPDTVMNIGEGDEAA